MRGKVLFRKLYTDRDSKFNSMLRQLAAEFNPACIAQLIRVELLQRRLRLAQIQVASSPET